MLKKVLITVVAIAALLAVGFVAVVAMQPSEFRYSRSATMAAPASEVFGEVNDLHKWEGWSPWAKLDPAAKNSFEGPSSGEGAVFHWAGNSDVGKGKMTITESQPHEQIRLNLEFFEPMAGVCETLFTFQPDGDLTKVTWTMSGTNDFMGKAFSLFMDCEKMVGGDFEKGLANMKGIVEATPSAETVATSEAETKAEN